jgi:hypothetical protein
MAFLSTVGLATIFVILYRVDRASRRVDEGGRDA